MVLNALNSKIFIISTLNHVRPCGNGSYGLILDPFGSTINISEDRFLAIWEGEAQK